MKQAALLSRPLEVGAIGDDERKERVVATEQERAAIAAALKLVAVEALEADIDIRRTTGSVIVIDGWLRANVVHTCVVSLEPAPQKIDETFHITYVPAGSREAPPEPKPGAEVMVDPEIDQPEVLNGTTLDLGAIVVEHLSLALDPYPRAPGAALPVEVVVETDAPASPFAVLGALKKRKT